MAIDHAWMTSWCVAAVLAVLTGAPQSPRPVPVTVISSVNAADGVFDKQTHQVIRDTAAWNALWMRVASNVSPAPAAPAIDFAKYMVVVAAMGSRGHGGYKVSITGAAEQSGVVTVEVTESSPGPGCMSAMIMTSPIVIASLPRSAGDVKFNVTKKTTDCLSDAR
jgi:hypothetical protein